MKRTGAVAFHCIGLLHHTVTMGYFALFFDIPSNILAVTSGFGLGMKFFTSWNMVLQMVYFFTALLYDLQVSKILAVEKPNRNLRKMRDFIFTSLAYPSTMAMTTMFWLMYVNDREHMFPRALDPYVTLEMNHVVHTNVTVFLMIEQFLIYHQYPSREKGLLTFAIYANIYFLWLCVVAYVTESWHYPLVNQLTVLRRVLFFEGNTLLALALYLVQEQVNRKIWGKEVEPNEEATKKIK